MLTRVEATNNQGTTLSFILGSAENGFLTKEIEGLDPVKATVVSSSFANMDGAQYQSSRRENRNIVMKLGYEVDVNTGSVRDLRNKLYGIFMPKSQVNLKFFVDEMPEVNIAATVESFESPLFTADPEATISLLCFDPDFITPTTTIVNGMTTSGATEIEIDYKGTVETGIHFQLLPDRALSAFTIYQRGLDESVSSLGFAAALSSGDVLDISTISGAKGATLTRGTTLSSILYGVSPYSAWINLFPGKNHLRVLAAGAAIPYKIEYATRYGGL